MAVILPSSLEIKLLISSLAVQTIKVVQILLSKIYFYCRPQRKDSLMNGTQNVTAMALSKNGSLKGKGKWKF